MTGRTISIRSIIFLRDRRLDHRARGSVRKFPGRGLRISWSFWLLLAVAPLVSPPSVVAAVFLAAAMHELGHVALLCAFHVPVEGLRLGALGAVIEARGAARLSYGRELLVTLGGPTVNLLCAPLLGAASKRFGWDWGYLFSGAHALLGVYNLLPIPPLDGGRALYLLTAWRFGPMVGDAVSAVVGFACALALAALGAYLTFSYGGTLFLLAALGLLAGVLPQLGLAKNAVSV